MLLKVMTVNVLLFSEKCLCLYLFYFWTLTWYYIHTRFTWSLQKRSLNLLRWLKFKISYMLKINYFCLVCKVTFFYLLKIFVLLERWTWTGNGNHMTENLTLFSDLGAIKECSSFKRSEPFRLAIQNRDVHYVIFGVRLVLYQNFFTRKFIKFEWVLLALSFLD